MPEVQSGEGQILAIRLVKEERNGSDGEDHSGQGRAFGDGFALCSFCCCFADRLWGISDAGVRAHFDPVFGRPSRQDHFPQRPFHL